MRLPGLPASRRLRHGQYMSEPINWPMRMGAGFTRYMLWPPHLCQSGSMASIQNDGGLKAMPCILPRPYWLSQVTLYQTGLGSDTDKSRLIIYDNAWITQGSYRDIPYPGKKLWEGPIFDYAWASGTKHTFDVGMGFPGNKIFWLGQVSTFAEFGSGTFLVWATGQGYPTPYNLFGARNCWAANGNPDLIAPDPFPLGTTLTDYTSFPVWHCTIGDP